MRIVNNKTLDELELPTRKTIMTIDITFEFDVKQKKMKLLKVRLRGVLINNIQNTIHGMV